MTGPSDAALWASVAETLRTVVVPALAPGSHAHGVAVQLVGLAELALAAPTEDDGALDAALDALAGNPLVPPTGTAADRAGAALVAAAKRGVDDVAAEAVRRELRPVLIARLDADLAATAGLGEAFRGRLPGG